MAKYVASLADYIVPVETIAARFGADCYTTQHRQEVTVYRANRAIVTFPTYQGKVTERDIETALRYL